MPQFGKSKPLIAIVGGVLSLIAAVILSLVLKLSDDGSRLVSRTNGSAAGSVEAAGANKYYTALVGQVCLSEAGAAKIRNVEPVDPHGGIEVTNFAVVQPDPNAIGAKPGRLRDEVAFRGGAVVSEVCTEGRSAPDLAIEVLKPLPEDAWAKEYRINYEMNDNAYSTLVRFAFGVCEKELDLCDLGDSLLD